MSFHVPVPRLFAVSVFLATRASLVWSVISPISLPSLFSPPSTITTHRLVSPRNRGHGRYQHQTPLSAITYTCPASIEAGALPLPPPRPRRSTLDHRRPDPRRLPSHRRNPAPHTLPASQALSLSMRAPRLSHAIQRHRTTPITIPSSPSQSMAFLILLVAVFVGLAAARPSAVALTPSTQWLVPSARPPSVLGDPFGTPVFSLPCTTRSI